MSVSQYLIYALIAVVVFTVYMAFVYFLRKDKNQLRAKKIDLVMGAESPVSKNSAMFDLFEQFLMLIGLNLNEQDKISMQLGRAGLNGKESLVYYLFFQRIIQPILFLIGVWVIVKTFFIDHSDITMDSLPLLIIALLLVVIGAFGTKLFIDNCNAKRKEEIIKTFPEALDLMLICVESGLGIDAALARVCKEIKNSHPIIAEELERTNFEMTVMNDRVQALQNLGDRTGTPAIRAMVSSLIQAEKYGTSLVDNIRVIAEEQRTERMLRAEAKAARLPALITLPLIFFIMPALFMIILGPLIIKVSAQGGIFGAVGG